MSVGEVSQVVGITSYQGMGKFGNPSVLDTEDSQFKSEYPDK